MNTPRLSGIALLTHLAIVTVANAQSPPGSLASDTLAVIGSEVVTARDLLVRVELMPWAGKERKGEREAVATRALSSLVGEKLLAREAIRLGIGEDPETALLKRVLEKHLVRDELYRREVLANVRVAEHQIREGLSRAARDRRLLLFSFGSRDEGDRFYRSWLSTKDLDLSGASDTIMMSFGDPDIVLEDVAYSIPKGGLSAPFESESGWAALQVLDEVPNKEYEGRTPRERRNEVEKIVRRRNEDVLAGVYYAQVLRRQKAEADPQVFDVLSSAMLRLLREDSLAHKSGNLYMIVPDDVDVLLREFRDSLNVSFIEMEDGAMSLGEVIESFRYQRFGFRSLTEETFRHGFNRCVRQIVQGELMAREGLRNNLQFVPSVKKDLAAWSEYWGSRLLVRALTDTISVNDEEMVGFLIGQVKLFGQEYQVNVREVLSETLSEATEHLLAVSGGTDLEDLARSSSIRAEWRARGGESGYFDVSENPHLGVPALLTSVGSLAGPRKVPRGYSMFELLGKRRKDGTPLTHEELGNLKSRARKEYRERKVRSILNRELARLADEYQVRIDNDAIKRVDVGTIQMFTRRSLGFGGVMTAVPSLSPLWEWFDQWLQQKAPLP